MWVGRGGVGREALKEGESRQRAFQEVDRQKLEVGQDPEAMLDLRPHYQAIHGSSVMLGFVLPIEVVLIQVALLGVQWLFQG